MKQLLTILCYSVTLILKTDDVFGSFEQRRLSDYVSHFEGLNYNTEHVEASHRRARRSPSNPHVNFNFRAHGRHFDLRLKKDTSVFTSDCVMETTRGIVPCDEIPTYEGSLRGEKGSHVHGSIIGGRFAGVISTPDDVYHVEKAEFYFGKNKPRDFHSVIYKESDMVLSPNRKKRSAEVGTCGSSHHSVSKWMEEVQNSYVLDDSQERKKRDSPQRIRASGIKGHTDMYSRYWQDPHTAYRREAKDNSHRTCSLFIRSDPKLWDYFTGTKDDSTGLSPEVAEEEIASLFAAHVKGVIAIYEYTQFKHEDLSYSGFTFSIQRISINRTEKLCPNGEDSQSLFCRSNIDVSNFLNLHSLENHVDFCLAYTFTYRDFTGGTLGLAWVGAATRSSGGICETWKQYTENKRGKVYKSLNTGIVTLVNYGNRVPPKVSTLTFAHEIGHNFGSPHDSGDECTPFSSKQLRDENGNYIMYASATSGDLPNNSKFSQCSIANITKVVHAVITEKFLKENCFIGRTTAFCGNKIVEEGETCDCGFEGECQDKCCHARPVDKSNQVAVDNQCKLKHNASCSPSQGPCCHVDCTVVREDEHRVCSVDTECKEASFCKGQNATCPDSADSHKEDNTACNDVTQICQAGECVGSICQYIPGWEQCYKVVDGIPSGDEKEQLCSLACRPAGQVDLCISTSDSNEVAKYPELATMLEYHNRSDKAIQLPPGAPCNNLKGYCDVFHRCQGVDADGPLARLKKLLLSDETFENIKDWITEYWWAVMLMAVALIVFMGLFIKVCAVHTPSSNPKKAPARKLTLRRQPRNRQHGAPPPGYAGPSRGGPPHGVGRGPQGRPHQMAFEMRGAPKV